MRAGQGSTKSYESKAFQGSHYIRMILFYELTFRNGKTRWLPPRNAKW
jgi:hypothetical protein